MADDTSVPIPGPNEVFVDRNRYITSKWYPWMVRLFKSLRETMGALKTVQETVDQVAGTWTLSINDNDRVTGYVKLDGSEVSTVFAVMADKFVIVHPSVNGTTVQAFVAGLVNGTPGVGINGDVLIDGTVSARHLNAESIATLYIADPTNTFYYDFENGRQGQTDGSFLIDSKNKRILAFGA